MEHKWKDTDYAEKMRKSRSSKEYRKKLSDKKQELFKSQEFIDKRNAYFETDEYKIVKEKIGNSNKKNWESPDFAIKQTEILKKNWESDDFRKLHKDGVNKKFNDTDYCQRRFDAHHSDEFRNKIRLTSIEHWKNPEYAYNVLRGMGKYKDFALPSGKLVKLQGYEPQVLIELLKLYEEDDIVIGIKEMHLNLGRIKYLMLDGTEHTYYPDFYIKSTNTIIEVKSAWTYENWKEKNLAKQKACLEQGFKFEFIIF
jgi:hypothetical protein